MMRKPAHLLTLAAGVALVAAVTVVLPVAAEEKIPAPTMAEQRGKIVRDEPAALRVEDMTEAELEQRRAEWEAGKRDDRDGYIILNQIWFNLQAQRKTGSPEFQAVEKKRTDLLKKKPELNNLQNFDLSDRIHLKKRQKDEVEKVAGERSKWKPWDNAMLRLYVRGDRALARYQYRLVFFQVPTGASIGRDPWNNKEVLMKDGKVISPLDVSSKRVLTYKSHIGVQASEDNSRFLLCTAPSAAFYIAMDENEIRLLGDTRVPWKNDAGDIADFCGIVSVSGDTVYKFPFQQSRPKNLLSPIVISPDGNYAAVSIGEEVEGEDGKSVSKPREVWTWEHPATLKKHPGPWKSGEPKEPAKAFDEMRRKFRKKPQ